MYLGYFLYTYVILHIKKKNGIVRIKHQSTQMNTARKKHNYVDWFITINLKGRFGLPGNHTFAH